MTPHAPQTPRDPERRTVPPDGRPLEAQPRWRQDFPIDWPQDEYVGRRELVKFIVLTSVAFVAGQGLIVLKSLRERAAGPRGRVAVARVNELEIGKAKTFQYPVGSSPRILVRTGASTFVAYDQACTHLMCPVVPARLGEGHSDVAVSQRGKLALHCPCHNGWFDVETGSPTAGPPRRPLPRVTLEVRGETVYATGIEEGTA